MDNINPSHYKSGNMECIEVIKIMTENRHGIEAACIGNITKYLYRYKNKGGLESVKKALWYLNYLDENREMCLYIQPIIEKEKWDNLLDSVCSDKTSTESMLIKNILKYIKQYTYYEDEVINSAKHCLEKLIDYIKVYG